MKLDQIIFVVLGVPVIIIVIYSVAYNISGLESKQKPSRIICTQEVKRCPDGSYVSKQSPLCEFKECPESKSTTSSQNLVESNRSLKLASGTIHFNSDYFFDYPEDWNPSSTKTNSYALLWWRNPANSKNATEIAFSSYPYAKRDYYGTSGKVNSLQFVSPSTDEVCEYGWCPSQQESNLFISELKDIYDTRSISNVIVSPSDKWDVGEIRGVWLSLPGDSMWNTPNFFGAKYIESEDKEFRGFEYLALRGDGYLDPVFRVILLNPDQNALLVFSFGLSATSEMDKFEKRLKDINSKPYSKDRDIEWENELEAIVSDIQNLNIYDQKLEIGKAILKFESIVGSVRRKSNSN
jgi:hypothetical protein